MKTILVGLLVASLLENAILLIGSHPAERPVNQGQVNLPSPPPQPCPTLDEALWQKAIAGDSEALEAIQKQPFPTAWIGALLHAAIDERFSAREKALYFSDGELRYWESDYSARFFSPKDRLALLDLRRERGALLDQWTPGWRDEGAAPDPSADFIPPGLARQVKLVEEDFNALIGNIRRTTVGMPGLALPADREKLQYLDKERRSEIARLLTPEELEEYDLRNSKTASSLRSELAAFKPTEAEFRGIFQIQQSVVDLKYPTDYYTQTGDRLAQRAKAQEEANAQIKALLGEQRSAEYTRAQDQDFRAFTAIADRLQLPADAPAEAYRIKTALEKKFAERPRSQSAEGTAALIANLTEEGDREFTRILGAKGYQVYQEYGELPRRARAYLDNPRSTPK